MGGSARDWWDCKGCRVNIHHLKFNHADNVDDKKYIVMVVRGMTTDYYDHDIGNHTNIKIGS